MLNEPATVIRALYRWGEGRPPGAKPLLLVMHIQEGVNDLWEFFMHGLPHSGPTAADCTIWNPPTGDLQQFLQYSDTNWTNGVFDNPTLSNPIIAQLVAAGAYPGDWSLTIEHAGFAATGITPEQLERSARMCAFWCSKYNLDPAVSIVGHRDISKKTCPGPVFPMAELLKRTQAILASETKLPYGAVKQPDGSLLINGYIVKQGFLDYYLTLGHNLPNSNLADSIYRAVKFFGLPKENEQTVPPGSRQKFERYTLEYDPKASADWQIRGAFVN